MQVIESVRDMWVLHGKLRAEFGKHGHEWSVGAIQLDLVVALASLSTDEADAMTKPAVSAAKMCRFAWMLFMFFSFSVLLFFYLL